MPKDKLDTELLVSTFATEQGLALAQIKTQDKSNEITATPELLDALILKSFAVTLDAMGCQKKIVKKIRACLQLVT